MCPPRSVQAVYSGFYKNFKFQTFRITDKFHQFPVRHRTFRIITDFHRLSGFLHSSRGQKHRIRTGPLFHGAQAFFCCLPGKHSAFCKRSKCDPSDVLKIHMPVLSCSPYLYCSFITKSRLRLTGSLLRTNTPSLSGCASGSQNPHRQCQTSLHILSPIQSYP